MLRILAIDDHLMFVTALQFLLRAASSDIELIPASGVSAGLLLLEQDTGFNLVLLDYVMPDTDGLVGLSLIKSRHPDLPLAILSGTWEPGLARKALAAGAIGWVPKTMSGDSLIPVLRLLAMGQRFVPPELMDETPPLLMSPREADVAVLLSQGMTDKEIADSLAIEPGTVKVHVKSLLKKAGVDNRTKFALKHRELG